MIKTTEWWRNKMKRKFTFLLLTATSILGAGLVKTTAPLYTVKPGSRICADRDYKLLKVPVEFSGLTAIQTNMGDKQGSELKINLEQPARIYGVFNWTRLLEASDWGRIPVNWKLYRHAVPGLVKNMDCDIYYIDLPAGQNTLSINASWLCLGIKPLDQLSAIEKSAAEFSPGSPDGVFAPGKIVKAQLSQPAYWKALDAAGKTIASGKSSEIKFTPPGSGLYLLKVQTNTFPVYVKDAKQVKAASIKNRLPICWDVRGIGNYWRDSRMIIPVLYSVAATMVKYGANMAYANLNAKELDIFQQFGITVIMDIRRDIHSQVSDHSALYGWFDSKVINKKDVSVSLKRYQEQKARPEIGKTPLLYKPMSFNASWLGCGGTRDALVLWRLLKPPVRTLRCTPFSGPCDARTAVNNNGADLASIFAITDRGEQTPWHMMFSAYGELNVKDRLNFQGRRIPDAKEITALCHLALANGAKCIYIYRAVQDDSLISPVTGTVRVAGVKGVREIADFLDQNSATLKNSSPVFVKYFCSEPLVRISPRRMKKSIFLYIVNSSAEKSVETQITVWPKRRSSGNVKLKVSLSPGGAKLLPVRK